MEWSAENPMAPANPTLSDPGTDVLWQAFMSRIENDFSLTTVAMAQFVYVTLAGGGLAESPVVLDSVDQELLKNLILAFGLQGLTHGEREACAAALASFINTPIH